MNDFLRFLSHFEVSTKLRYKKAVIVAFSLPLDRDFWQSVAVRMKRYDNQPLLGWKLVCLAWIFALAGVLQAQKIAANITNIVEPTGTLGAPTFVIDSDASNATAGYERDLIPATVSVFFTKDSTDASNTVKFRVRSQLIDSNGNPVMLAGGDFNHYSATQDITVTNGAPTTSSSFTLSLDPDVDLGVGESYTIHAWVEYQGILNLSGFPILFWFPEDGPDSSSSFAVMHFTNTVSGDAERNVLGYTNGTPNWTRSFAVIPDVGFDNTFRVSVPYYLARYDLGGASTSVQMRLTTKMTNDLGQDIPLKNGGQSTVSLTMASQLTGGGLPNRPQAYTGNFSALFEPVSQLDSSNRTYRVNVQLEHVEIPTSTYQSDGISPDTALTRLLHFNGNLYSGSLLTNFEWLAVAPTVGAVGVDYIQAQITVGTGAGSVPGHSSYSYGNSTTILSVFLYINGTCTIAAGAQPLVVAGGGGVNAVFGGVTVNYPSVSLQGSGPVASSATVRLPQGLGYNPDRSSQAVRYESVFPFSGSRFLNSSFRHTGLLTSAIATDAWVFDESRPMLYKVTQCEFDTSGVISFLSNDNKWVHSEAVDELETQQSLGQHEDSSMALRLSNEGYLRYVSTPSAHTLAFVAASDGTARTNFALLATNPGSFYTHFPRETQVKWYNSGDYKIIGGWVEGTLINPEMLEVNYDAACADDPCGPAAGAVFSVQASAIPAGKIDINADGALHASCLMSAKALQWGFKGDGFGGLGVPTHRTDDFTEFDFLATGNHLYDSSNTLSPSLVTSSSAAALGAACVHLAGYDSSLAQGMVYPQTAAYRNGVGSYAGATMVVLGGNADQGASRIADMPGDSIYTLQEDVSKYYVRSSGVSGRQVAELGSFDDTAELYGYGFIFNRFQLTFLSDENRDSWINGSVTVPFPSDFEQAFQELKLSCSGALESALIDPLDRDDKPLSYWNGTFQPQTMRFVEETGASCYATRFLTIGLISGAANLDFPLVGSLAFEPSGNIAPMSANLEGVDGRLGLPASVAIEGPGDEKYQVVPVSKLYFNDASAVGAPSSGYVGFAGRCNVPFFEDLKLHVMTSARSDVPANIYLTGGWTEGGETFFSNRNFDADHRAFPSGFSVDDYRAPQAENAYVPHATQSIFGLVDLDYPLQWDLSGRFFKTWGGDREVDLFVVDVQHQVEYRFAKSVFKLLINKNGK